MSARPATDVRRWAPLLVGGGIVLWIVALALLAVTTRDSQEFGRLQPWILVVNAIGVVVLLGLLAGRIAELVRDRRAQVPGSRLRSQSVAMLAALVLAPLLLVFTFSVLFLTRGIDSWFHVEVRQGLTDALGLSRAALDLRMREYLDRTVRIAEDIGDAHAGPLFAQLDKHRRLADADELAVVASGGRVEAYSASNLLNPMLPGAPEEVLLQARRGEKFVSLDPAAGGGYVIRAAVPINNAAQWQGPRVLVAVYPVPQRLADLAEAVQGAYQQYGRLSYLREPLKISFVLTLSLVLLMALLAAMYGAFFFSDRLIQPVQDLIGATRAVAKGDFDTRVTRSSHDEIGFLVASFNDMTKRLARARAEADTSRQAVENERTSLAVILARLSTGVISLERDLTIRVANHAAGDILGADLQGSAGRTLEEVAATEPLVAQLLAAVRPHADAGQAEWREQVTLRADSGRRELMCACTALPGEAGQSAGLVLVFDDITQLLQAQREAAWGEVARRLAHEIKNPLTPIQLSAERMRRRLLAGLPERDAETAGPRDAHDRAAGRGDEADGQRVQRVRARPGGRVVALRPERADAARSIDLYRAQDPGVRFDRAGGSGGRGHRGGPRPGAAGAEQPADQLAGGAGGQPDPAVTVETRGVAGPGAGVRRAVGARQRPRLPAGRSWARSSIPMSPASPKARGWDSRSCVRSSKSTAAASRRTIEPGGGALVRVWLPDDETARGASVPREARKAEPRRERA